MGNPVVHAVVGCDAVCVVIAGNSDLVCQSQFPIFIAFYILERSSENGQMLYTRSLSFTLINIYAKACGDIFYHIQYQGLPQ